MPRVLHHCSHMCPSEISRGKQLHLAWGGLILPPAAGAAPLSPHITVCMLYTTVLDTASFSTVDYCAASVISGRDLTTVLYPLHSPPRTCDLCSLVFHRTSLLFSAALRCTALHSHRETSSSRAKPDILLGTSFHGVLVAASPSRRQAELFC